MNTYDKGWRDGFRAAQRSHALPSRDWGLRPTLAQRVLLRDLGLAIPRTRLQASAKIQAELAYRNRW